MTTMHRLLRAGALALLLSPALPAAAAAQRDTTLAETDAVRAAAARAVAIFNAPETLRVDGRLTIDSARTLDGDVAVFGGTLVVAGHVTGRVAAINAGVELRPGARVDGDVVVVGGTITGREAATVGGTVTAFRDEVRVRQEGDRLELDDQPIVDRWWERWQARHARSRSTLRLTSGGTYNRVEGLPVHLGPILRQRFDWGRINLDAYGIYRSARDFRWDSRNIGHDVKAEVVRGEGRDGRRTGRTFAIGGRLYDVVTPVESWHLGDTENGLATFFLHRDFRDHFDRHGGTVYARTSFGDVSDLTLAWADQRWGNRGVRDPWTLFRDEQGWRAQPLLDEGRFHLANATLKVDTRNDVEHPWSGWYVMADVERGRGRPTFVAPAALGVERPAAGEAIAWTRGFLDVRRYNRIAPNTLVNLRLVAGGWLGGDPLPLNRRLSLSGPGTLPGLDFRSDALPMTQCQQLAFVPGGPGPQPAGAPAQCDRIVLAQVEYRQDLSFDLDFFERPGRRLRYRRGAHLVVFANSGRGWLVGDRIGELRYGSGQLPDLSTFRTDVGGGLDFGIIGFYAAKSVSDGDEPPNFFVRLRRRF